MMKPTERRCLGCKAPILTRHIACFACWMRLPLYIRELSGIRQATGAHEWFKTNPESK